MKNALKKIPFLALGSMLLSSLAMAGSFTVVNDTNMFIIYSGYTKKNGDKIFSSSCSRLKACVVSDDDWGDSVTYIKMTLSAASESYTISLDDDGNSLTNHTVVCTTDACYLPGQSPQVLIGSYSPYP